jgi:peptidoglycan L-alanyl-D-glutamate endopeptidase CwlK
MPKFGQRSKDNLSTADPDLQRLFNEVIKTYDCTILCGHRGKEDQNRAFHEGRSKVQWPNGKHNRMPSDAVDVAPWFSEKPHIRWEDKEKFYHFAGYVQAVADQLGIKIRWGGNWDSDDELDDQTFFDLPHFELLGG